MKTEILTTCDQLVPAAISSIGEGILLVAFVACGLRALGRTNAATRHAIWFFTLILLIATVPAQWLRDRLVSVHPLEIDAPPEKIAHTLPNSLLDSYAHAPSADAPADVQMLGEGSSCPPSNEPSGQQRALSGPPDERLTERLRWRAERFLRPGKWDVELGSAVPRMAGAVLVAVWAAVAAIRMVLLLWRMHGVRNLKKSSLPPSPELDDLFRRLCANLVMTRNVELRVSRGQRSALVLGFFHPVILFPIEEGQPADLGAARQVLGHELAHVHRFDDWANLVQHFIQAVLFFHPAVWWVSKQLALEREIACDDFVLHQGGRPQEYALLLVDLAGRRRGRQPMLAPGVSTRKCQLKHRINMILNVHRNTSPRLAKARLGFVTTATALVALLTLYAAPRLVLAQNGATPDTFEVSSVSALLAAPQIAQVDPPSPPQPATADAVRNDSHDLNRDPSEEHSGPRFKEAQPAEDAVPTPPAPPERRKPRAAATPRPARAPDVSGPNAGIEERLARLERMVQSLVAQQKAGRAHPEVSAKVFVHPTPVPEHKALTESRAAIKRETARAAEMAKRATKQAEKAVKMEEKSREVRSIKGGVQVQLQSLHEARETLQREMEKLERHIEQIQREQERAEEMRLRRGEDRDEREDN